jgi:hypothetical protein
MSESVIAVKFANGEIDKMTRDTVVVNSHNSIHKLESFFVKVSFYRFLIQVIIELQILYSDLSRFFKDNQPIDIPSVKSKSTASIINQFPNKLENN